jgi:hypothetical protein
VIKSLNQMTPEKEKEKLQGRSNYSGWYIKWQNQCAIEGWTLLDGTYSTDVKKVKEIKTWLNGNIALTAMDAYDAKLQVADAMKKLANEYGKGSLDKDDLIDVIKEAIFFNPNYNPNRVFRWLTKQVADIVSTGETLSLKEYSDIVLKGLDPAKGTKFWFNCRGSPKMAKFEGIGKSQDSIQKYVSEFWRAHASAEAKLDDSDESGIIPLANYTQGLQRSNRPMKRESGPSTRTTCEYCSKKENGRTRVLCYTSIKKLLHASLGDPSQLSKCRRWRIGRSFHGSQNQSTYYQLGQLCQSTKCKVYRC